MTLLSIFSLFVALIGYNALDPQKQLKAELQKQKLLRAVNTETVAPVGVSKKILDSLTLRNQILEQEIKAIIKNKKQEDLKKRKVRLDTLIILDK